MVQTNTETPLKNMARFMEILENQMNEPLYKGSASLRKKQNKTKKTKIKENKPSLSTQNKTAHANIVTVS